VTGFYEHGIDPTGSIRGGEFLDFLGGNKLLKKAVRES
jgi:hypothetical protein